MRRRYSRPPTRSNWLDLLSEKVPFAGVVSDSAEAGNVGMGKGFWASAINVRCDGSTVTVRYGASSLFTAPLPSGCTSLAGWWAGDVGAVSPVILLAFRDSTPKVRIYSAGGAGAAISSSTSMTEETSSSNKYGNTRMTDSARVTFCPFPTDSVSDTGTAVYISNGTEARVYSPSGGVVRLEDPSAGVSKFTSVATFKNFWQIAKSSAWSGVFTNSGAQFLGADYGAAPYNVSGAYVPKLTTSNTAAVNDNVIIDLTTTVGPTPQVFMVMGGTAAALDHFRNNYKITFSSDSGFTTPYVVYDPSSTTNPYLRSPAYWKNLSEGTNNIEQLWVFTSNEYDGSSRYVKFTLVGKAPSASTTVQILAMGSSGQFHGGAQFGVSFIMPSGCTGGGFIETEGQRVANLNAIGGPKLTLTTGTSSTTPPDLPPIVSQVAYDYEFTVNTPSYGTGTFAQLTDARPIASYFYYRPGAQGDYVWIGSYTHLTYGASWSYTDSTQYFKCSTYSMNASPLSTSTITTLPTAENQVPPPGTSAFYGLSRLFVVQPYVTAQRTKEIWFSQQGNPSRFQIVAEDRDGSFSESLGSIAQFEDDVVNGIVTGANEESASQLLAWTTRGMYAMSGLSSQTAGAETSKLSSPSLISGNGLVGPRALCEYQGAVYWVDHFLDLQRFNGRVENLSYRKFHEDMSACPAARRQYIAMAGFNRRIYIGVTPSGGTTNTKLVVWNTLTGSKESVDSISNETFEHLLVFRDTVYASKGQRLLVYSNAGKIGGYEENATGDYAGTGIVFTLSTGKFRPGVLNAYLRFVRVQGDVTASTTIATARTYSSGAVFSSTLKTYDPYDNTVSVFDSLDSVPAPDGSHTTYRQGGPEISLSITGTLAPGKRLTKIAAELVPQGQRGGVR